MKFSTRLILCILIMNPLAELGAQIIIPVGYFSSPLGVNLVETGSFAEVRANHFHSGIDFSIQQKEGLPVFAAADGVISRIKVSPVGFGNALYIDHPNGFTSVYAHMKGYNDTISEYLHANQYKNKSFEVDLFPENMKDFIYVKKGDVIGYAGNSGSSGGAHLHFELRDTKTENIINPQLFGFNITDNIPPYIDFIKIYPEDKDNFFASANNEAVRFEVKKMAGGEYRLSPKDTIEVWGNFSVGVQAFDFNQNKSDRNGFYSLNMFADNVSFYSMSCDSFAFAESRFVNASIDYAANYNHGYRILKSKRLPGNKISFIKSDSLNGLLNFTDERIHEMQITVADLAGNKTNLLFWVKSEKPQVLVQVPLIQEDSVFLLKYDRINKFETSEVKVDFPLGSLYEDMNFKYRKSAGSKGMFSAIHYLHDAEVPIHNRIRVSVKATDLPQRLRSKALLVRIDRDGKRNPAGGSYENGYITTTANIFDGYAIVIDTVAPSIKSWPENNKSKTSLKFTVSDNFSGISTYRAEVDGKWALVEWDPKNKLMVYHFDQVAVPGKNTFKLFLEDEKGNKSSYSTTFTR